LKFPIDRGGGGGGGGGLWSLAPSAASGAVSLALS